MSKREPGTPEPIGPNDTTPVDLPPRGFDEQPMRCRCLLWARADATDLTVSAMRQHHSKCPHHPLFDPACAILLFDEEAAAVVAQRAARLRDHTQEQQRCRACSAFLVWSDVGGYWWCISEACPRYCRSPS